MIPRPTWLRFLCAYFIHCIIALLAFVLVLGVPLALIVVCVWHK